MLVWVLAVVMVLAAVGAGAAMSRLALGSNEIGRKSLHVVGAFGAIALAFVVSLDEVALLMALMSIVIALSHVFGWPAPLHRERHRGYGDILLPVGALAAALLSPSLSVFVCAMVVVGLADSLAGLVGRQFGARPIWPRYCGKTYLGSATFFIVAALACGGLLPIAWYAALLLAAMLTIIEYFAPYGSDNLLLPIVVVLMAQYLL